MRKFKIKKNELCEIDVEKILFSENHPRKNFDMYELTLLAESLRLNGMIQPLVIRETRKGLMLVSGERRLRAAIMAGFITVPCIKINAEVMLPQVIPLVENLERKRLSMFEEAEAIATLLDIQGVSQQEAAEYLGLSPSAISNKLRLLRLTEPERRKIEQAKLSERQARSLLKINNSEDRLAILGEMIEKGLNIEKSEELVEDFLKSDNKRTIIAPPSLDERIIKNTIFKITDTLKNSGIPVETRYSFQNGEIEFVLKSKVQTSENELDLSSVN